MIQKPIEHIIKDNMMNYSAYVLLDRALPDIRDGLKPVHRRILVTMLNEKAFNLTKSANISGSVMKLHPHGDSYPTIVNMVQRDKQNIPYIVGKGNFAQHTSRDMQPGASRYTEIKLSEVAKEMLSNLKKGMVKIIPNYDGTLTMPEVLPVKFPTILTHTNIGIGVGFSSSIPSFNLQELAAVMIEYINTGKKTNLVPDFATGGLISNDAEMFSQINETGLGSLKLRGKAKVIGNEIAITDIPYTTSREAIIKKIVDLSKAGKFKEILDVKDLTGLKGQLIEIRCRKNSDMQLVLDKLFKLTPLEASFSVNMNILINNLPKVVGTWEAINEWLTWRKECIVKGLTYDTVELKKQLHLLRGLERVLLDIDTAIEIIRHTAEAKINRDLMKAYDIDETQADNVSNMKLRHINRDHILKKIAEIEELAKKIALNEKVIGSDTLLNKVIIKGLKDSSEKYGTARKTQIVNMKEIGKIVFEEEKTSEHSVIIKLTKDGYAYKLKAERETTLKTGDKIINEYETFNSAELLVFTEDGSCHKVKLNDIPETKAGAFGTYLPTITEDINIVGYSVLDTKQKFLVYVFENKKIAKIDLQSFIGNRKKLKNSINLKSPLINILTFNNESTFKITTTRFDMMLHTKDFSTSSTRGAMGAYATNKKGEITKAEKA